MAVLQMMKFNSYYNYVMMPFRTINKPEVEIHCGHRKFKYSIF